MTAAVGVETFGVSTRRLQPINLKDNFTEILYEYTNFKAGNGWYVNIIDYAINVYLVLTGNNQWSSSSEPI